MLFHPTYYPTIVAQLVGFILFLERICLIMNSMEQTRITPDAQKLIDETFVEKDGKKKPLGRVTFVQNPVKTFGIIFNHAYPLDVSIIKYCFQGCPFAFHGDEKVWIKKDENISLVKLRDLSNGPGVTELPGTLFLSCDDDGKSCWVPSRGITSFPLGEERHWLKIRSKGGREVVVTNDHDCEIWTRDGWKRIKAEDLRLGDCLPFLHTLNQESNFTNPKPIIGTSLETAFVGGVMLGDAYLGTKTRDSTVTVSLNYTTKEWIAEKLIGLGSKEGSFTNNGTQNILVSNRSQWQEWLGTALSLNKKIPSNMFSADNEHIAAMLSGLFHTDGHIDYEKRRWQFSSISKDLVDGTNILLSRLGIATSRWVQKERGHSSECFHVVASDEDCEKLISILGRPHELSTRKRVGGWLRMTPNQLMDGCHGKWFAQNEPTAYSSKTSKYRYPSIFAETMRNSDAWCSPIEDIQMIEPLAEDYGFCPIETPHKRIVTSNLLIIDQCFATSNKRAVGDVIGKLEDPTDQFLKMIQKSNSPGYNPQSLQEWCLHHKYPTVFSNNVDPFLPASEEQYKIGERVLRTALEYKQPLFIQTKEVFYGDTVRDLIIEGKDLFHLYVSISTLDYDKAKQYETVAVTPLERLERIKYLTDRGVTVTVALNPYVPEWEPNLKKYFQAVKDCGAVGVYTYPLHLTSTQKKVMPKRMGQFVAQSNRYEDFYEDVKIMEVICKSLELKLHYPRRMPDDFYNGNGMWSQDKIWPIDPQVFLEKVHEVYLSEKMPVKIEWKDIDKFFTQFKEWENVFDMSAFAGVLWTDNATYFDVRATLGKKNKMKNIVKYVWNNPESQDLFFQFYNTLFILVDGEGMKNNESEYVLDDNGDVIYIYDPEYSKDGYYIDQNDSDFKDFVELD